MKSKQSIRSNAARKSWETRRKNLAAKQRTATKGRTITITLLDGQEIRQSGVTQVSYRTKGGNKDLM